MQPREIINAPCERCNAPLRFVVGSVMDRERLCDACWLAALRKKESERKASESA